MARMPLRTRALTALIDSRLRPSIVTMDQTAIHRARGRTFPERAPVTWVLGRVPPTVAIKTAWCPTRASQRRQVRIYRPLAASPVPVVVFFHGGGFVLGSTAQYDPLCAFIADQVGALVVSVDYRLAPEHPAPAGIEDCVDAVRWVGETIATRGGDPSRLALCGDSAGGNLAALVAIELRDHGGPALAHQALIYPATDLSQSFPSIREHADAPILDKPALDAYLAHYLRGSDLTAADPRLSPYFVNDLSGLPPALVQTADLDPLRDEGQAYAVRLAEAGVPVRATNYLGTVHGFMSFPGATVVGPQARLELATELRRHLL
ncbi:MAG: alpha/beta hydrolase [Dermatophilaceae bacterium]